MTEQTWPCPECGGPHTFIDVARQLGASFRQAMRLLAASLPYDGYQPLQFYGCVTVNLWGGKQ